MQDFRSTSPVAKLLADRKAKQARIDPAEADRERRKREYDEAIAFVKSGNDSVAATADAIVKAARTRDAGGPELPQPTGAAAAIIAAGKRRRGESE